jgi:hypothetical protein
MARPFPRSAPAGPEPSPDFSLVEDDAVCRLQRRLRLMPAQGLGVSRRALLAVLITWVPIATAAAMAGRLLPGGDTPEPLLQHFGINVRLLVAVPLLIVGEALLEKLTRKKISHFVESGLVAEWDRDRFAAIVARIGGWHSTWKPWLVIAVLIASWTLAPAAWNAHDLNWAAAEPPGRLDLRFATWWYMFVARPIFIGLFFIWLWRLGVLAALLLGISRLHLSLVPTHPDRAGGLGFLSELPYAFSPLTLALATVLAAQWGHQAVHHGVSLESFKLPLAAFTIVATVVTVAPLLVFVGPLLALRRREKLRYGALVGEYDRLVHRRWILGEPVRDGAVLGAPELGPAADVAALYDAVQRTRPIPFHPRMLLGVIGPTLLPMIPLVAVEMRLVDALRLVLSTLR